MNTFDAKTLKHMSALELLREFHSEAEGLIANLEAIGQACQSELEHSAN